ncbi:MAG: hypothetical protein HY711_04330 [Candidatus Melainabacteria bacterium]|nr:hypothetical protein [Candidatus Melainabacteria bacterium]
MTSIGSVSHWQLIPPAYADEDSSAATLVPTGILRAPTTSTSDCRLSRLAEQSYETENERAYYGMAAYGAVQSQLPPNTFMVAVDGNGAIFSADGKNPLTVRDIHEFWTRISETNTAGLTTMAMAHQIRTTTQAAVETILSQINQLKQSISLKNNQLQSNHDLTPEQQAELRSEIEQLTLRLPPLEQDLGKHQAAMDAAEDAYRNGSMAASITDTIVRNQRALSSKGFKKDAPNFILGGQKFVPHPTPPTTLNAIINRQAGSGDQAATDWTAKTGFSVYDMTKAIAIAPRQHSWLPAAQAATPTTTTIGSPKMYLFEFGKKGRITVTALPAQPFRNVSVSHKQLFAISYDALITNSINTSAESLPVTWTVTMRDMSAFRGKQKGGKHGGQPMPGSSIDWCESTVYGKDRKPRSRSSSHDHTKAPRQAEPNERNPNERGPNERRGVDQGESYNFFGIQPAFAGGDSSGGSGGGSSSGSRKVRSTYTCGGLATEFQIRSPIVKNAGFSLGAPLLLRAERASILVGSLSTGPATAEVAGQNLTIPGTSNYVIRIKTGPIAPPTTMSPGGSCATETVPTIPTDLM